MLITCFSILWGALMAVLAVMTDCIIREYFSVFCHKKGLFLKSFYSPARGTHWETPPIITLSYLVFYGMLVVLAPMALFPNYFESSGTNKPIILENRAVDINSGLSLPIKR